MFSCIIHLQKMRLIFRNIAIHIQLAVFQAFSDQLLIACGGEVTGSMLLNEMAGFLVRESQFRKKMEKFKAAQSKDINFEVCYI